jgi:hypothetical protein
LTCCKEIPIIKFNCGDIKKLNNLAINGKKIFSTRYNINSWYSLPLIDNYKYTSIVRKQLPCLWWTFEQLNNVHTEFKGIKSSYLSVLNPRSSIPWHKDMSTDVFSNSFLTSIKTEKSFIEFENDKKYTYNQGYSYVIRSSIKHRILNLSDDIRITICTTPTENPYV